MKKRILSAALLCTCIALTIPAHAAEFELLVNTDTRAEIPMYKISGETPVLDGSFSEAEWGEYLVTDAATPDNPNIYCENSYNNLSNEDWYDRVFTPVRYYATYDDTYVYVCVMTEDIDHACVSSWEGDYADIRIWKQDNYAGEKNYQFNNGITDPSAVLQGTAGVYDYAFARDEAECVTCYEFRIAWKDITDGTPDEFRLRIGIGFGISDYEDCDPQYPPFMGATAFGFADMTRDDDTKHNGNTIVPAGEKPVETEPEVVPVEEEIAVVAPQTADAGIITALLMAASAAGTVITRKKH